MDAPTSALNLEQFSYRDERDGWICTSNMTEDQHAALQAYLFQTYDLIAIGYQLPYLVLRCCGQLPDESTRPFTIAGALVVWLSADDPELYPLFGDFSEGEFITIPENFSDQVERSGHLTQEVLNYFAFTLFPDCIAIAVVHGSLVVQLRETDMEVYIDRMQTLPRGLRKVPLQLRYCNGFLPNSERAQHRVITPSPASFTGLDVAPTLVHSSECKVIEEYMVGNQPLIGMGHQYLKKTRDGSRSSSKNEPTDSDDLPQDGQQYMELTQGIYHARPELIRGEPRVRDRLCGSAIVRAKAFGADRKLVDVAHEGGVCGVMQHWEVRTQDASCMVNGVDFLHYAEVLDQYIEDGSTVDAAK
ncbi:hypothetical protein CkaCkLH20_03350 [Colletotrichum karsti]|uniref:Uncharacterized protein n=1 Tax=Colletotrichum karsti TaxID=1095194 RepID=A0A9P6I939_9PEZI|nr:uncharacterized protein CkaCkLH20_03350 [Colletotrichum karsti]KAF9879117.1 hypothetical protein CkaCkLH20_03350 [Colletotrichum karsti]